MTEPPYLTPTQQAVAVLGAASLFVLILALIYRRKLREDYAALWFAASGLVLLLALWQEGLRLVARLLDAVTLTAPLFLISIVFLTVVAIHLSVRLSGQARQVTRLAQDIALLRGEFVPRDDEPQAAPRLPPETEEDVIRDDRE